MNFLKNWFVHLNVFNSYLYALPTLINNSILFILFCCWNTLIILVAMQH